MQAGVVGTQGELWLHAWVAEVVVSWRALIIEKCRVSSTELTHPFGQVQKVQMRTTLPPPPSKLRATVTARKQNATYGRSVGGRHGGSGATWRVSTTQKNPVPSVYSINYKRTQKNKNKKQPRGHEVAGDLMSVAAQRSLGRFQVSDFSAVRGR